MTPIVFFIDDDINKEKVFFYSRGEPNEPIHVHIDKGSAKCKIWLHSDNTVSIASNIEFSKKEQNKFLKQCLDNFDAIVLKWNIHFNTIGQLKTTQVKAKKKARKKK